MHILSGDARPQVKDQWPGRVYAADVADAAARTHKEDGFIGIGGKEISDSERAALDELEALLGNPD